MFENGEYSEYLNSQRWKNLREVLFLKTGKYCKGCGTTYGIMHAHHMDYSRLGCERISDLVVLCKKCHDDLTREWRRRRGRMGLSLREFTLIFIKRRRTVGRTGSQSLTRRTRRSY